jgi:mRNA interferase MazF
MIRYDFGDVVLVDFPQSGNLQRKRRPALVILDIDDADLILAPITSKQYQGLGDYRLKSWQNSGLLQASWVRLAKLACLEKQDISRTLGKLSDDDKELLINIWNTLYKFSK